MFGAVGEEKSFGECEGWVTVSGVCLMFLGVWVIV